MLTSDVVDVFGLGRRGLGQDTPAAPPALVPEVLPAPSRTSTVIIPALPDDVAVRCRFDENLGVWRCAHGGFFEQPSTFVLIAGGLAIFAFGFFLGNILPLRQVTKLLTATAETAATAAPVVGILPRKRR